MQKIDGILGKVEPSALNSYLEHVANAGIFAAIAQSLAWEKASQFEDIRNTIPSFKSLRTELIEDMRKKQTGRYDWDMKRHRFFPLPTNWAIELRAYTLLNKLTLGQPVLCRALVKTNILASIQHVTK
jgi:hypothetical protein